MATITKQNESVASGTYTDVTIAHSGGAQLVTAARTASGNLLLQQWQASNGALTPKGTAAAGAISHLSLVALRPGSAAPRFVTGVSTSSGTLKVIVWDTQGDNIVRRGSATAAG